jgi:hypothetical protein
LVITFLIVLALNAAHASSTYSNATGEVAVTNTTPSYDTPADSGQGIVVAKGKDAHLVDGAKPRSFEEPDYALLSGKQPSQIGCDVPLEGEDKGVLIFLGIFSAAVSKKRRDM